MPKMPATIEQAKESLSGIQDLLTAKQWERAAIVYAFTRDGGQGLSRTGDRKQQMLFFNPVEFAALKIAGLEGPPTVRRYRRIWKAAVADGLVSEVNPDEDYEVPEDPEGLVWEEYYDKYRDAPREEPTPVLPPASEVINLRDIKPLPNDDGTYPLRGAEAFKALANDPEVDLKIREEAKEIIKANNWTEEPNRSLPTIKRSLSFDLLDTWTKTVGYCEKAQDMTFAEEEKEAIRQYCDRIIETMRTLKSLVGGDGPARELLDDITQALAEARKK